MRRLILAIAVPILLIASPAAAQTPANAPLNVTLLDDATTGESCHVVNSTRDIAVYIEGASGVTAGAVQLEEEYLEATSPATRQAIGTATTVVASTSISVVIARRYYRQICARISTTVSGGGDPGVTVYLTGH